MLCTVFKGSDEEDDGPCSECAVLLTAAATATCYQKYFKQTGLVLMEVLDKNMSCSKLIISVTEHLVEVVDKSSTTAVVFFRSERILKCKCLYGA